MTTYLLENDKYGKCYDDGEYEENILLQINGQIWERQCQGKIGHPVGEHANGKSRTSSVLSEAFSDVDKWYGSQANCEADDEQNDAHDAQVWEDLDFFLEKIKK